MTKCYVCLIVSTFWLGLWTAIAAGAEVQTADFYVAPDGNDANPGTNKKPLATLKRARDAVRELKQKAALKKPITVMIRGGKYFLRETLVLGGQDGGTRDCPITYMAYPGEKPILSGGRIVTGWKPYQGKILQCDLPGAKGGKWKFRQLFFNGKRQIRARTPNDGWFSVEGPAEEGSSTGFKYKPGVFKHRWAKPTEAEVHLFFGFAWGAGMIPVKAIDPQSRIITLVRSPRDQRYFAPWFRHTEIRTGNRFRVENVLEELDSPGEWCLDSEEGKLYFWPPTDGPLKEAEVVVPALDCLIDIMGMSYGTHYPQGACYITISGFTFTETTGGDNLHPDGCEGLGAMFSMDGWKYCGHAVHLNRTERCRIENNHFDAVGGNALYLRGYNARNVVRNNQISGAGANGICLAGAVRQHPIFNRIVDNHIHHCGVLNFYTAGVFAGVSDGNVIGNNSIHHMPHHAINLGSNGIGRNIVQYNDIRHAALETHDTGAINAWMDEENVDRPGHIIWYNLIADTSRGIYFDDYTSNSLVFGNLVIRCNSMGINVHGGKNNIIENNIIVGSKTAILYSNSVSGRTPHMAGFQSGNRFCRNIIYNTEPNAKPFLKQQPHARVAKHNRVWGGGYDHRWLADRIVGQSDYNLIFNTAGAKQGKEASREGSNLAEWQEQGYDEHSVVADPLFVNPAKDDYRLKPESPAWKLGFQQIDRSRIGITANGEPGRH